ncbi:MAG: polysaccharide deacetylase family protein [Peptococcaceae bacterium]|nr:polysaccharide deacetylase family protein [Peptococcaceae bacterium]
MAKKFYYLFFLLLMIIGFVAWNDLPQSYAVSGQISLHSQLLIPHAGNNRWENSANRIQNNGIVQAVIQDSQKRPGGIPVSNSDSGIILTFDDKSVDDWYSFLVLNNKYGVRATFYVSSFHTLDLDKLIKLKLLQDAHNEIGYHTTNHINALRFLKQNSMDDYMKSEIFPDFNLMKEKGFHVQSMAYPYGAGNGDLDKELLKYFKNVRYTSYPQKDKRIADLDSVYLKNKHQKVVSAVGIDNGYGHSLEEIFQGIDRAYNNHEILVLYGHVLSNKPGSLNTNMDRLETIIQYAQKKGMKFHTISDLDN